MTVSPAIPRIGEFATGCHRDRQSNLPEDGEIEDGYRNSTALRAGVGPTDRLSPASSESHLPADPIADSPVSGKPGDAIQNPFTVPLQKGDCVRRCLRGWHRSASTGKCGRSVVPAARDWSIPTSRETDSPYKEDS